jgi:hypothetical protein
VEVSAFESGWVLGAFPVRVQAESRRVPAEKSMDVIDRQSQIERNSALLKQMLQAQMDKMN